MGLTHDSDTFDIYEDLLPFSSQWFGPSVFGFPSFPPHSKQVVEVCRSNRRK